MTNARDIDRTVSMFAGFKHTAEVFTTGMIFTESGKKITRAKLLLRQHDVLDFDTFLFGLRNWFYTLSLTGIMLGPPLR